ncbi:MAG: MarR family transcriptional regulator [Methanobrevibacter sp.]|nr:MarR family transcriptional regulator [Methanobrevibacter sp.]
MIEITLVKEFKGKDLVKIFEKKYGSMDSIKRVFERGKGNVKLELDLDDWKYFLKHTNELVRETKIIYTENPEITMKDISLLSFIKNQKPQSIKELADLAKRDISTIQRKVTILKNEGLIEIKNGTKNRKVPIFNYDKMEIAI